MDRSQPSPPWGPAGQEFVFDETRSLILFDTRWNWLALAFVAAWVATAVCMLSFRARAVQLAGTLVIAAAIVAMQIVMHEASHGNMFRDGLLDRWTGVVFGAPGLVSASAYRVVHRRHHRQSLTVSAAEGWLNGTPAYLALVPLLALRHGDWRDRRRVATEYALLGVLAATLAAAAVKLGSAQGLVRLWLQPLAVAVVISSIRGWTETLAEVVARRPALEGHRFVRPFCRLLTDHLEHHLCPSIPWYNLPRLRGLLRAEYDRSAPLGRLSYLTFLWNKVEGGQGSDSVCPRPAAP